ncbi:TIGR02206 family membrane protein [Bacillus sp. REN10]|uniref:YwaF family protein n=1 Tax=Bacillus sp. REN10 TaxID=2782541 RepID=UPI00193B28F5|nr:TIGR02206 family membrane protein [Bacillus sp. REN10]
MDWFGGSNEQFPFHMFSASHITILFILVSIIIFMYVFRNQLQALELNYAEISVALFLLTLELAYHVWMIVTDSWDLSHSIPLELCSISLLLTVILLISKKRIAYEILLFTGLLGASQALVTPFLTFDFPHFRFFHFFITHMIIFCTPLYFTWVKGYRPTIYSVFKMIIFVNVLMPFVMTMNWLFDGNYLYLHHKPEGTSLLDLLGPYPWYILSLEFLTFSLSLIIWLIFREKNPNIKVKNAFQREL